MVGNSLYCFGISTFSRIWCAHPDTYTTDSNIYLCAFVYLDPSSSMNQLFNAKG